MWQWRPRPLRGRAERPAAAANCPLASPSASALAPEPRRASSFSTDLSFAPLTDSWPPPPGARRVPWGRGRRSHAGTMRVATSSRSPTTTTAHAVSLDAPDDVPGAVTAGSAAAGRRLASSARTPNPARARRTIVTLDATDHVLPHGCDVAPVLRFEHACPHDDDEDVKRDHDATDAAVWRSRISKTQRSSSTSLSPQLSSMAD